MAEPTTDAALFARELSEKFDRPGHGFAAIGGRLWDKIVAQRDGTTEHVHAFVNRRTGTVHKAHAFNQPIARPRYATVAEAVAAADEFGAYLYVR